MKSVGTRRPRLERFRLDLSDAQMRRSLFGRLAQAAAKALVITEGLLIYLRAEEVAALAEDLKLFPAFKRWLLDIASPGLLRVLRENTNQQFGRDVSPLQFAPRTALTFLSATAGSRSKCILC